MEEQKIPLAISDSLSGMLKQFSEKEKQMVGHKIQEYMHEYKRHIEETTHNRASIAASWQDFLNGAIEKQLEENAKKGEHVVACGKSCSHCCYQNVDITNDEAYLLTEHALEKGVSIDVDHLARQLAAHQIGSNDNFNKLPYAHRACVFLDEHGDCKVYKYRPMVCRKLMVASDPKHCDTEERFGDLVARLVSIDPEMITCAVMNACEDADSMAKMLFKEKDRRES